MPIRVTLNTVRQIAVLKTMCYNSTATPNEYCAGFFVPIYWYIEPDLSSATSKERFLRRFGVATKDGRSGFVLEGMMAYDRRKMTYRKHWKELISMYGSLCFWCREELATCIDHCIPYSWDSNNDIDNLVPSCMMCNAIAGDKMFESVEHKRQHIMARRKAKKFRAMLRCSECLVPFVQCEHSPSPFLCAHCYDIEYDADVSSSKSWRMWLRLLDAADIPYLAHWEAHKLGTAKNKRQFTYSVLSIIEKWEGEQ